jgi:hypothetical protein
MKQETDNEMDLLLRRFSRRDDEAAFDGDHLDADELSAYAENGLPAAARARYMGHLAECSRCRSLVVQLSSSAAVVASTESAKVSAPSGLKKFLASLFTPMVLRYAAPALGLIIVAAIGFMVLRRNQSNSLVTQVTKTEQPPASPSVEPNVHFAIDSPIKGDSTPAEGVVRGQAKTQQTASPPPPNAPPVVSGVQAEVQKDKAVAQPKQEEQPATVAANEPPPPKSTPEATVEQVPKAADVEVSKKEVREKEAAAPQAGKAMRAERDKDNFTRARKSPDSAGVQGGAIASGQRNSAGFMSIGRTVAGRQFRKEGGVWIDTGYDSSKDVVTLTRGSEQYRALVADEPSIKTIADTLPGEIIVVWKGHTYRIH